MKKKISVILVCGGSCSGKSIFASLFKQALVLSMDHFYFGKSQMKPDKQGNYDFDAPESVDIIGYARAVKMLTRKGSATIPVYDMKKSERVGEQTIKLPPKVKFLIVEGIFAFQPQLRKLADLRIFLDTPTEIRVARRMLRDVEKGRSELETLSWSLTVEGNHRRYVEPMKKFADLVIPFSYNPIRFPS